MNVQCPACASSYDVSGRPAGTMMTCHCGETFGFPRTPAAPVDFQCAGCGAHADPRLGRCPYCDRILKSVCCPQCYTLMADGENFCAHCGIGVAAPAVLVHRNGETALPCPRCSTGLTASLVGDHLFDRCESCGGIWAHHLAIAAVFADRGQRYSVGEWLERVSLPDAQTDHSAAARCPDCEKTMQRQAIKDRKGLVIDTCNDHGIWFDYRELRSLVGRPRRRPRARRAHAGSRRRGKDGGFSRDTDDWWPFEAIEDLIDYLEDLFD